MNLRYLALGDSYTIAEGLRPEDSWAWQLCELLDAEGFPLERPEMIARTGWTTDELAVAIAVANPTPPFALVSLLTGVNDQYRGRPVADYRDGITALLRRAAALANGDVRRVLVLSIPDWGVTPFAEGRDRRRISREIDAFNSAKREACLALGSRWVDITPLSRLLGTRHDGLAGDGLHYSSAAHGAFARAALPAARLALRPRP